MHVSLSHTYMNDRWSEAGAKQKVMQRPVCACYLVVEPSDHLLIALQLGLAFLQLGLQAADLILNTCYIIRFHLWHARQSGLRGGMICMTQSKTAFCRT